MDELDHALIAALRVEGRAPLSELARRLQVSRGTVQNRLSALLRAGEIVGFTVRVKPAPGEERIRAVMLLDVAADRTPAVAEALRGFPQILGLYSTNGAYDLLAEVEADALAEVEGLLAQARALEGVERCEACLMLAPV